MTWRHGVALLACVLTATLGIALQWSSAALMNPGDTVYTDLPLEEVVNKVPRDEAVIAPGKDDEPKTRPAVPASPRIPGAYRFVSAPDFLNQDVADLTADGREEHIDPNTGKVANSTNAAYEAALDSVLSEVGSHGADDLLVAGDLVEGRWGRDDSGAGVFGPVNTDKQRLAATRRAAATYYRAWSQRMAEHELTPYPAVGDHEIGDDPWTKRGDAWIGFKRTHVPAFKRLFAREVLREPNGGWRFVDRPASGQARDTAYAVRLDDNVLLVTVDPFTLRDGKVRTRIDRAQLTWLRGVLRKARKADVPWVVVQGHTPIAGPVRSRNSSQLTYQGGTRSALWQTMVEGGVDVYLCGEVHDQTVSVRDGIVQVAHGSLFYRGEVSYVFGQATARELLLENHQFQGRVSFTDRLWTTSGHGAPSFIEYPDASLITGTLVARRTRDGGVDVEETAGIFRPLR